MCGERPLDVDHRLELKKNGFNRSNNHMVLAVSLVSLLSIELRNALTDSLLPSGRSRCAQHGPTLRESFSG